MARTGPDPRNISCWIHSLKFPSLGKGGPDRPGPTQARTTEPRTAGPDSPQTGPDRPGQRFVLDSIPVLNNQSLCWLRIHSLGFSSWVFTPQGLLLRAFRLRPKVRAACVPWGLGLRPKVPGFTLHSLGSSSSGKVARTGPDSLEPKNISCWIHS